MNSSSSSRSSSRISASESCDLGSSFVSVRSSASSVLSFSKSRQFSHEENDENWRVCLTPNLFQNPVENRFLCVSCLRVLQHPVSLSACDHFVCSGCLGHVCRANKCRCPKDSLRFNRHECLPDQKLEKEISQLTLECPHKHSGCVWIGKFEFYQEHFESCLYTENLCPNGCDQKIEKRLMENHLSAECSLRTVDCEFCGRKLKAEAEIDHLKECPKLPVTCPKSCGKSNILREDLDIHLNTECTMAELECPYMDLGCSFKGGIVDHSQHLQNSFNDHVTILCESVKKQAKLLSLQENKLQDYEKKIKEHEEKLATLVKERETQLIWKIDKWDMKFAEAKSGKRTMLYSVPFQTGKQQYKLSLVLFPNGDRKAKDKFVSLYVRVCRGEYDNLLSWPFSMEMDLILIDQSQDPKARSDYTYTLRPNPCKDNLPFLGKPIAESNPAFGMQNYVPHDLLESRDYIRDDTVFIKVCVRLRKTAK